MVALCMTDEIVREVMDGNMFVNSLHSTHPFSETEMGVTTHAEVICSVSSGNS